jgi:hypothetical protein
MKALIGVMKMKVQFLVLLIIVAKASFVFSSENNCERDQKVIEAFNKKWLGHSEKGFWADFEKLVSNHQDCTNPQTELYTLALQEHWGQIEEISKLSPSFQKDLAQSPNATLSGELENIKNNAQASCPSSLKKWCQQLIKDCNQAIAERNK